ncbi:MAG: hypothetical protein PHG08_00925 [Bacilli bacterium]|nr:hypothetical protein [Bacilli bacterium]
MKINKSESGTQYCLTFDDDKGLVFNRYFNFKVDAEKFVENLNEHQKQYVKEIEAEHKNKS